MEHLSLSGKLLSLRPGAWGLQVLSLCPEPELREERGHCREKPAHAAGEQPPLTTAREGPAHHSQGGAPPLTTAREGAPLTIAREKPAQQ